MIEMLSVKLFIYFLLYSNICITFKRKKFTHQVILIDILPGKTKNGLKI